MATGLESLELFAFAARWLHRFNFSLQQVEICSASSSPARVLPASDESLDTEIIVPQPSSWREDSVIQFEPANRYSGEHYNDYYIESQAEQNLAFPDHVGYQQVIEQSYMCTEVQQGETWQQSW